MEEKVDYKKIIEKIKPELEKAVSFFEEDLKKIKTSRASTSLIEEVMVECFGQKFPLKKLAQISIVGPKQILIQPWDGSYIEGIIKAIEKMDIGLNPVIDKNSIKINLPTLSEEFRKDLIRLVSEKKEKTKQIVRKWREKAWSEIQERCREGKIREDDKYKGKNELQKLVDEINEKIEELSEKKKKEILE
jgi:ribosome recycling factor